MAMLIMNVLGGLAIFVFGMKMMSDGLHKCAGEKMKNILSLFTANRYVAIVTGTVVTAVIQSSSATTTMVIGFINAGLLNLMQAIGIIFGANIGTTVTAQLVAFDISSLIMPAITAGVCMMFVNRSRVQNIGETVLGFGLLFLGMMLMSDQLKVLSDNPSFRNFFALLDCAPSPENGMPWLKVLGTLGIGLLVTLCIQSSSACTGIVIAMGAGGLLNLHTAVVLVLGSNIGTTVTAQLAAIPANRIAKQAALAHTLFNVLGVIITVGSFAVFLPESPQPLFFDVIQRISAGGALPRQIANAHTVFNVFTSVVLIPAIPLLARVCQKVLPVRQERTRFQRLEPHLLISPVLALQQSSSALRFMVSRAWKMVDMALRSYDKEDGRARKIVPGLLEREKQIDEMQKNITDYLQKLMQEQLTPAQARCVPVLIHCTNDAERIGDHTEIILNLIASLEEYGKRLSTEAESELEQLRSLLKQQAHSAAVLLSNPEPQVFARVFAEAAGLHKQVGILSDLFEGNHLARLKEEKCSGPAALIYIEFIAEMKKVSRHLGNITERTALLRNF